MTYHCRNHPQEETRVLCAACRFAYCDGCLVEFLGQKLCGPCRDARLSAMQYPRGYRFRRIVDPRADRPFRLILLLVLLLSAGAALWAFLSSLRGV